MRVPAGPPDPSAFAPFGTFIDMPASVGERRMYSDWLAPVPGLAPHFYTNRVRPAALPVALDRVERHPHAAQLFLPLVASRYLVTVMPSDAEGRPQPALARAFVLPRELGVAYHPGIWHAGITALDDEASFSVLMWRGAEDDDVFAAIPRILIDVPAEGGARG
jgi:ureidoglycolate lyase